MGIDLLLIAVGCGIVLVSVLMTMRGRHAVRMRLNSLRGPYPGASRPFLPPVVFGVGLVVAVVGGSEAQLHHIGWWALAVVFIPIWLVQVVPIWIHNRRLDAAAQSVSTAAL